MDSALKKTIVIVFCMIASINAYSQDTLNSFDFGAFRVSLSQLDYVGVTANTHLGYNREEQMFFRFENEYVMKWVHTFSPDEGNDLTKKGWYVFSEDGILLINEFEKTVIILDKIDRTQFNFETIFNSVCLSLIDSNTLDSTYRLEDSCQNVSLIVNTKPPNHSEKENFARLLNWDTIFQESEIGELVGRNEFETYAILKL